MQEPDEDIDTNHDSIRQMQASMKEYLFDPD
jgi:hypothetical protein